LQNGLLVTCLISAGSILNPNIGFLCSLLLLLPTLYYRSKLGRAISALIPMIGLMLLQKILLVVIAIVFSDGWANFRKLETKSVN
jgi:hypothetical protein